MKIDKKHYKISLLLKDIENSPALKHHHEMLLILKNMGIKTNPIQQVDFTPKNSTGLSNMNINPLVP